MSLVWAASVLRPQAVLGSTSADAIVEPWNELAERVLGRSWRRQMREQNHRPGEPTSEARVLDPLIEAYSESINAETVRAGVSALRQIVLDEDHADRGRLTAAVLLTCTAAAELDDYTTCDAVLDLGDELSANDKTPDARLLRAALLQQRALRNRDSGRSYKEIIEAAIDELGDFEPELCEPFETTTPNESSTATLEHIRLALLDAAYSLIPFELRTTHRSRVRPDQVQYLDAMKGESYAGVLARNYAFHATGTPSNQANSLGPTDPFFVALGFELLGHHGVYAVRKELAQTRFVDLQTQGQASVDEVPRLLRHSCSKRDLDLALNWLAANGPLEVLLADSRQILTRRADPFGLRTLELRVLRTSAGLLTPEEKEVGRDAIDRVLDAGGPFDLPGEHEIDVLRAEQAWLTLASLADTPQSIDRVSRRLLAEVLAADPEDQLLDRALAAALDKLDWDVIQNGDSAGWQEWLKSSSEAPGRQVRRIVENGLKTLTQINERHPLSHLAERIDRVILGLTDDIAFGPEDIDLVRQLMRGTREQAARGVNTMGGIPESDVAAALITRAGVTELWPDLTEFLIDPVVLPEHKSAALNRLAASGQPLPDATRIALTAHAQILLEPTEHSFFQSSIRPFPPALRLLAVSNCISHTEVVAAISALMQDQEAPARREAAITANSILQWNEDPWVLGLVLHMSFDRDARVRAHAGQGLVSRLSTSRTWDEFATNRVQALLTADGTTSVIAVLAALKEAHLRVPTALLPTLEELASNHISGSVRREARALVARQDQYRNDDGR